MDKMKSFSLAYKTRGLPEAKDEPEFDIHINLWNAPPQTHKTNAVIPFIDFGIKFTNYQFVEKISFTIPFHIKPTNIVDLSHVLNANESQLIFNDIGYKYEESKLKYKSIRKNSETISFLPIKSNISSESFLSQIEWNEEEKYCSITINIKPYYSMISSDTTSVYFRFRIESDSVGCLLLETLKEKNYYLESAFNERQIIDIKFNDSRNIASNEISRYGQQKFKLARINVIHLFVMVPSFYEVTIWDGFSECRRLEKKGWDNYLQNKICTENVSVFHWVKRKYDNNYVEKFTKVIKMEHRATNLKLIFMYCLIVVILGALSSGLCNIIEILFDFVREIII